MESSLFFHFSALFLELKPPFELDFFRYFFKYNAKVFI